MKTRVCRSRTAANFYKLSSDLTGATKHLGMRGEQNKITKQEEHLTVMVVKISEPCIVYSVLHVCAVCSDMKMYIKIN